ncbi:NADP-dependent oxidoreductase domain-containing protein [Thelonectria olida]|uniref:NADP-dependent oxidoreductase domain-containing protein n=1 Tax=Thelonectria olida TaxID=1576542 RepID=A0A9P9ANN7_9HYPO|nr:NADP-dependent oxidoreductase domain-containing protein [Thelonectria olida]
MAVSQNGRAHTAHVNMMTDTIIANLSADGLRIIMRSLLACHPEITASFERETRKHVAQGAAVALDTDLSGAELQGLKEIQQVTRCMLGSGLCFQSLPLLQKLAIQGMKTAKSSSESVIEEVHDFLVSVDGDIVQAMTAVQKTLFVVTGVRTMSVDERLPVKCLYEALLECEFSGEYIYSRGLDATASTLGITNPTIKQLQGTSANGGFGKLPPPPEARETFQLGVTRLPRIFSGLWQMSSPAWGAAPTSKMINQFSKYVQGGYTAFDMADHYGDAEIIFGRFRSLYPYKESIFAATKYCVFHPMTVSREAVRINISQRCQRLQQDRIDLLQFHWQNWNDAQYLDALRFISEDKRVGMIGLCNFDTEHLEKTIENKIPIYTNQVQFSLIDSRPTVKMGEICAQHNVRLLTYGTLCGGFLAHKWMNKPEPDIYDKSTTPSQRKYHGMIRSWGGWQLFQGLLHTLNAIAAKHDVSISNVATRWVLDFPYVGAVIVGARMGISEHTEENLAAFGWSLDSEDLADIERVLAKSKRMDMFETMGDCGREYRL